MFEVLGPVVETWNWVSFGFGMIFSGTVGGIACLYALIFENRRKIPTANPHGVAAAMRAGQMAAQKAAVADYETDFMTPDLRGRVNTTVPKGKT